MSKSNEVVVVLGNQLFPTKYFEKHKDSAFFMAEDHELCTHFKYHKHKILLFLIAMRRYKDELKEKGFDITYREMPEKDTEKVSFMSALENFIKERKATKLTLYEVEDTFFEEKILALGKKTKVEVKFLTSPFFMVTREEFKEYLDSVKAPFMKTFYERLRKKTGILMEKGKPEGGKFSFDSDNRSKLPKDIDPPPLVYPKPEKTPHFSEVKAIVEKHFSDHPGDCDNFWLATERKEALKVFRRFLKERLPAFGKYQDAITSRSDFVFHSVISPYINMGLLLPEEVIQEVEKEFHQNKNIPLNSAEGFIRQVLGWREFVRGIYQNFDKEQQKTNFFNHKRKLSDAWYEGNTGIPPLDDAIKKSIKYGYAHHIERLMIVSNLMLLCQIHPQEVYRWFMEMFVDSSDWVMGPNVFGMGQFSDGGIFATKPYMSGSNYLLKMSDYQKGEWCQVVDGLYWSFIERNKDFFSSNPRLGMMVRTLEKMNQERKEEIFEAAEKFLKNGDRLKV